MDIYYFDNVPESLLFYGGHSGRKLGVIIDDQPWMIKFAHQSKRLVRSGLYNNFPVNEYIGSHIFKTLGIPAQETRLGFKDQKIVVACKDFTDEATELIHYRKLLNYYSTNLVEELNKTAPPSKNHGTNLNSISIHFKYNPIFKKIPDLEQHFWNTTIVDILINNNDRNSENWGILLNRNENKYSIPPVYDNGSSFYNHKPENTFKKYLADETLCKRICLSDKTPYHLNERPLSIREFLSLDIPHLKDAIMKMIPLIKTNLDDICHIIDEIPNEYDGMTILGANAKEFYKKSMIYRFTELLYPRYLELCKEKQSDEM